MDNINIYGLPDIINPNKMVADLIKEKYESKCPVCGETRLFWDACGKKLPYNKLYGISAGCFVSWYGYPETEGHLFTRFKRFIKGEKYHHYRQDSCHCHTCGAKWDTPPYPTDIIDQKEIRMIYNTYFGKDD